MKYGIEVEGTHCGTPMIFCGADDVLNWQEHVLTAMTDHNVSHVYVSDQDNVLDYADLSEAFAQFHVTLDCTQAKGSRPANVSLMLRDPTFDMIRCLNDRDQIKYEHERTVYVWSMQDAVVTLPSAFEKDIEL